MTNTTTAPLIPREVLFGNPEKTLPRISPDGGQLAYLAPVDGVLNVWVGSIETNDYRPVTRDDYRGIRIHFWSKDGGRILYLQDVGGDENWRLYAVDLEVGQTRELTPFEGVQVQVVAQSKRRPLELIVGMNRENPELHDAYRLDLDSGDLELVAKNPGNVIGWVADADLRVRGAMAATPEGGFDLLVREDTDSEWQKILTWDREDSLTSAPVGFSGDGRRLHLKDSRGVNASRLVTLDLESNEVRPVAEDPYYDVGEVLLHPDTYEIQAISFDKARSEWLVLDEEVREDFAAIQKLHPGDFSVLGRSRDEDTWVVGFTADDGPTAFFAYDRRDRTGTHLFDDRPELARYELASMRPISYETRDGLTIHGYLTLPPGTDGKDLPLVLNVHGGPWARDHWGYDPEAQWFANRGYACLQVNYRGSTGYGKQFLNAGDKEWGAKMHDDLVDAVEWAVREGIADRERLAIYGGSYGGYAALVGATFTPELFKCAVDIVGPSNLITLIESIPPYWRPMIMQFHDRVGNPETEREFLESRSPLFKADEIKIPLLIAQGAHDPRVKQAESEQIVAALEERGLDYEYLLFNDEGHGFARPENRLKFYAAAEKFLAKHLGGRVEE
jgi:dipeptidyl aminopeptidase/acylaminoacyl peptidase